MNPRPIISYKMLHAIRITLLVKPRNIRSTYVHLRKPIVLDYVSFFLITYHFTGTKSRAVWYPEDATSRLSRRMWCPR
jgi:hypothetical protein